MGASKALISLSDPSALRAALEQGWGLMACGEVQCMGDLINGWTGLFSR